MNVPKIMAAVQNTPRAKTRLAATCVSVTMVTRHITINVSRRIEVSSISN